MRLQIQCELCAPGFVSCCRKTTRGKGDNRCDVIGTVFLVAMFALASLSSPLCADDVAVSLPEGVRAVWDLTKASRGTTPTRERICLNGLWRWQPADAGSDQVPASR